MGLPTFWLALSLCTVQAQVNTFNNPRPDLDLVGDGRAMLNKFSTPYPPDITTPDISELDRVAQETIGGLSETSDGNTKEQIHGAFMRGMIVYKKAYDTLKVEVDHLTRLKIQTDNAAVNLKADIVNIQEEQTRVKAEKDAKDAADLVAAKKRLAEEAARRQAKMQKDMFDSMSENQKAAYERRKAKMERLEKEKREAELEEIRLAANLKAQEDALAAIKAQADEDAAKFEAMSVEDRTKFQDDARMAKRAKDMLKKTKLKQSVGKLRKMLRGFGSGAGGMDGQEELGPDGKPIAKGSGGNGQIDADRLADSMADIASLIFGDDPNALAEAMKRIGDQKKLAGKLGPMEEEKNNQRRQLAIMMRDQAHVRGLVIPPQHSITFFDQTLQAIGK